MKYLVTGYSGQLGYDIVRELENRGYNDIVALDREKMDITNSKAVTEIILTERPDVIFHCAAWTAVDKAEECKEKAYATNVIGTRNIVEVAKLINAKIFYISTDYVFDGTKNGMYEPKDVINPLNVYGQTKYWGEEEVRRCDKHFIVRISWVFGINGANFVRTMLKLSETKSELNVVSDQIGSPTYTVDLSKLLVDMSLTEQYGTYHATNDGFCSWAEFADYIFTSNHKEVKVNHVTTEEYLQITGLKQAYRPKNSKLNKEKLVHNGFAMLPSWQDAVNRYSEELKNEKQLVLKK